MLNKIIFLLLYGYYILLLKTIKFKVNGKEQINQEIAQGLNPVFASAHNSLLPCVLYWDGTPATLLASRSKDGQIITNVLLRRQYKVVRGSSSRGGKSALKELIDCIDKGEYVAVTFDGPKGPPLIPKVGIGLCAAHAKGSLYFSYIIPQQKNLFGKKFSWCIRFNSWDKFLLPLPFARLEIYFENITVENIEKSSQKEWINLLLNRLELRAKEIYGHLYAQN